MSKIFSCWFNINRKIRLTSIIVFLISLLVSSFIFLVLVKLEKLLLFTDLCFSQDLVSLLTEQLGFRLSYNTNIEVNILLEKIYLQTSSLKYIKLINYNTGEINSFPSQDLIFDQSFFINQFTNFCISFSRSNRGDIIFTVPIVENEILSFLLILGMEINPGIKVTSNLISFISPIVFVSVWLMFLLGIILNFLFFIDLNNDIVMGLKNISKGNFSYRIYNGSTFKLKGLISIFNKMSERLELYEYRNVQELTYEKIKFETLLHSISDGVILLDNELRLVSVNRKAINIFSWNINNIVGKSVLCYLPLHVKKAVLPILNQITLSTNFCSTTSQTQELYIKLHHTSLKIIRILLTTVVDEKYRSSFSLVMILQDITRESELNKAKNQFVSNVSHELRTPLCNIGSFLETLIDYNHKLSWDQKKQFLDIAYNETQRLNRLVNDVLDLSRLESKYRHTLSPLRILSIYIYINRLYYIVSLNRKIEIITEVSSSLKIVYAHENSLYQVISNLVSNSLKFTHIEGKIVIRAYEIPEILRPKHSLKLARIEIIDEGIGIEERFYRHVFDRFMRIENNIHTLQGTGLGLSIVKSIVEKHNSTINLYSEVKVGTSFWFDLRIDL